MALPAFLAQLVDMFRLQAEDKDIGFVFDGPDRIPAYVHTDEHRLRQILINLLSNAIKFTPAGQVTLRVRWRSEIAEFDVIDTGIGIAPDDLDRIFEPLQRVKAREQRPARHGPGPHHRPRADGDHGRRGSPSPAAWARAAGSGCG